MMKNIYFLLLGVCIALGSCSTEDAAPAAQVAGSSSQALLYLNCRAVSDDEIEFDFSRPAAITSISFEPALEIASIQDGKTARVRLAEKAGPGILLKADLLAEDEAKNTINVVVSFRSRNDRMPSLVINEVRTEYSNPKAEFIEFKMKTAGNLGAMRVFMAGGSQKPYVYEFAPVEVGEGEYVTLHLRKIEEACMDEYGDAAESGGTDSSDARDFWAPGTAKLINKTGVIYVLDQDNRVLDAVMFSDKPDAAWSKDYLAEAAGFLFSQGAWKSAEDSVCLPTDAVNSEKTTATRTICRDETAQDTNTAADWYITAARNATPGRPNSDKRFGSNSNAPQNPKDETGQDNGTDPGNETGPGGENEPRNDRMPKLVINEVRTEYSRPSVEFIELKVLSDGNLDAVRVFIASNNKAPMVYKFLPLEVEKDEYLVLHLRTLDESCVDEYGSDLSESGGSEASSTARDFWIPGSSELLRKTDMVYLLDQDDNVLDAVMFSETQNASWANDYLAEAADFLFRQGAWKLAALSSAGTTITRTICRDETTEDTNTATDWYITAARNATPGSANSEKRYSN